MKAAYRYANSLLQLAVERGELEAIANDMETLGSTIDGSRDLMVFLRSPVVNKAQKLNVLNEVFAGKIGSTTSTFIDILVRKGRADEVARTVKAFKELYNTHSGILEIEVTSATELSSDQQEKLKSSLESKTGKKVVLLLTVDPSVRGGIRARIDDTVIDGTIVHKLEQLRNTLLFKG